MSDGRTDPARVARFEALFGRVHEPLLRYARRRTDATTADEVVAETLTVLWRRLEDVPVEAEVAWCYGIARRCLANARRADGRRLRLVARAAAAAPTPVADPGASVDTDPALDAALAGIADGDRELLKLWAWEQLEPKEIAAVLDITANAASIRLHRAKQRLRSRLESERIGREADREGDEDREEVHEWNPPTTS